MNVGLTTLAEELSTTDRTLRRAVAEGLLRADRPSPRKLDIPVSERDFLRRSWNLLSELRKALRTEPSVALAVLFGSAARGEMHARSDVDILIALRVHTENRALASRLSERLGRRVQLVSLEDAQRTPLLLAEALRDGRVLVDRERLWPRLRQEQGKVERAAARERKRVEREFAQLFA
jgi:predicted nucleotidyltransferase